MHDAYELSSILDKLQLQIDSIACYSNTLLIGTRQGQLLVYDVPLPNDPNRYKVLLERPNKSFSKAAIVQLYVVTEYFLLVSLSDSVISVHDLTVFTPITVLKRTKGCNLFSVSVQKSDKDSTGSIKYTIKLCVSVKRKLQFYVWNNRDFHEHRADISLPDTAKVVSWGEDYICVGLKREYLIIDLTSGEIRQTLAGPSNLRPMITPVSEQRALLQRDTVSVFVEDGGATTCSQTITWNEVPQAMIYHEPYFVSVLSKYIEIRTDQQKVLIQQIDLSKPKLICQSGNNVYIASASDIWKLNQISFNTQITQLLKLHEFNLALTLANMCDDSGQTNRIQNIKTLLAFDLFTQKKYDESLKLYSDILTDVSHVIGLYPNLLPTEFQKKLVYPDDKLRLEGSEHEKALTSLIKYLTQKRNDILKTPSKEIHSVPIFQGNISIVSKNQLHQIIDTTLLKCYLITNDALVAPLLRLPDNNCHQIEAEKVLLQRGKHNELIILYKKKQLHRKALELLVKESKGDDYDSIISYLQVLGSNHMEILFEYAMEIFEQSPSDGIKIFTEDIAEIEMLPRHDILIFLEKHSPSHVIFYLEHVISVWHEDDATLHNALILAYRDYIINTATSFDDIQTTKQKLISFLEDSNVYSSERILSYFTDVNFSEERALLLGHLGKHEEALRIYIDTLKNLDMALRYCGKYYDKDSEKHQNVYIDLIKINITHNNNSNNKVVIKILKEHSDKLDVTKVLETLSDNILLYDIKDYIEKSMSLITAEKRNLQVLKSLLYSEQLQVHEEKKFYEKQHCIISEEKVCALCKKRIGNSAFARYPNKVIVHYYCCKDIHQCPV